MSTQVQYELMYGRDAIAAVRKCPVGFLPIGCLERHGDHLPMGLDVLKAHRVCCAAARQIGGVVFPPHYYSGIHLMAPERIAKHTGQGGNLYTDASAKQNLTDLVRQFRTAGVRVLVLYTGHYPKCQVEMVKEIEQEFADDEDIALIAFAERMILEGDHAGISETSFLLHLAPDLVQMDRIGQENYQDHGWGDHNTPEKATAKQGQAETAAVIAYLKQRIAQALP